MPPPGAGPNIQITTFGIGKLLAFVAINCTGIAGLVNTGVCAVTRLWPDPANELPWPPANTLPEDHADRLAGYLDWLATRPGVQWRPMPE